MSLWCSGSLIARSASSTACSVTIRATIQEPSTLSTASPISARNLAFSRPTCYKKRVISPDDFRRILGHFATGVTVITVRDPDGRPTGLTASAFTSVSLDPPLILVCVDHKSQSYPSMIVSKTFAVNILSLEQEAISRRFATTKIENKFEGVSFTLSPLGLPLIDSALAHLECATVNIHPEGDHSIFVGRVEQVQSSAGLPLVYYRGRYDRLSGPTP
ncbi:MAG: flavin reductase [Candidatus Rokuibacteriota bacterium]|nr:MAG: flavin reductase [Candidatus Rokubacteria bacterium]